MISLLSILFKLLFKCQNRLIADTCAPIPVLLGNLLVAKPVDLLIYRLM